MNKHEEVAELLAQRIRHGDYLAMELPTEMTLAAETGVSRMTARKAIQNLIRQGLLTRKGNRRVTCGGAKSANKLNAVFLSPSWVSSEIQNWRNELEKASAQRALSVRPVDYVHWDDPSLTQALDAFDAVFLVPMSSKISPMALQRLKEHRRLVVLGEDFSHHGLLSINPFPPGHIAKLLDILKAKGCFKIDCVCAQPLNDTTDARIRQWRMWLKLNACEGELLHGDFKPFSRQAENAYAMLSAFLPKADPIPDAFFSVTMLGAVGTMRACLDCGLEAGRDVHVCAVNGEGLNRFLSPSLSCLEQQDVRPLLSSVLDWMESDASPWDGPLLLQAETPCVFEGESTGAVAAKPKLLDFKRD